MTTRIDPFSFPSGHTSRLGAMIPAMVLVPWLSVLFAFFSILAWGIRMIKGFHYFTDCFFGLLAGILCGVIVILNKILILETFQFLIF